MIMTTLTIKEMELLKSINKGMDEAGEGWLHELAAETKETAGVLGSLVKKALVNSCVESEPDMPDCSWVVITEKGKSALNDC